MKTGYMGRCRLFSGVVGVLVSALAITGCASSRYDRAPCALCEQPTRYVRLQDAPHEATNTHAFSHPFTLSVSDWAVVLRSIQVQTIERPLLGPVIKGVVQPAFSDEEVQYLSETLNRACADAAPEEWVVFALMRARQPGLDEVTTGAWYARGADIHLRLSNYRIAVSLPGVRKIMWQQPTRQQPGAAYDVVSSKFQRLTADREVRTNPFANHPVDVAIDFRPLLARPPTSLPSNKATENLSTPSVPPSVEERLNKLKQLRDQRLITEQEYRTKKGQILDTL